MKKNASKNMIFFLAIPALLLLVSTCKSDNSLESSLISYEPLLSISKYISYNLSSTSRTKGVYTLSLTGTQSFDSNFWGWEKGEPQGMLSYHNETSDINDIPEFYISGKTLNTIHTFNDNSPSGPQYYHSHSSASPFADGTFSTNGATTGIIRPLRFETIKRTFYNTSGELVYDNNLRNYSLTYDDSTGLIESYSILAQNNTTDEITLNTYGFTEDPRSSSSYYVSSFTEKTGETNTLVGSITTNIEVNSTATNPTETYTYKRFDQNGDLGAYSVPSDLGYLSSSFFNDANSSTIVKIVKTVTTYRTASGSIAANSVATVKEKYSSNTNVVFKEVEINHYESAKLHKIADYQKMTYNVSGSTETQISQSKITYTNGFMTLSQAYSQDTGWTTPSSYIEYERDTQGRLTSKKQYSSGILTKKQVYTFDSSGRTSTIRSYAVDSNSVETCSSDNNKDYTYETVDSEKLISEIRYSCSGTTLNSSPSSKVAWSYNSLGNKTKYQYYTYTSSAFLLWQQYTYGYGSSGEIVHEQKYSIDGSGEATKLSIIEYSYDENLFRTSEIEKDSAGEIFENYHVYSYTYK